MNAIMGIIRILQKNKDLPDDVTEALHRIYASSNMLLEIINDVLDLTKIEAGKMNIAPARYEMASMINDAIALNIMRIKKKPITFELDIDENVPARLYGDALRIKQIISNLLSNAFKYTIWLSAWVKDTGMGIKPEDIGSLFTDYTQMDTRSNRTIEGTGLGLPIAKKMTELMGQYFYNKNKTRLCK
jgi:signal transduction histidine kinase